MAKKAKFYAVKAGRVPGIYFTWDDCKAQVDGFKGACYKSFDTPEAACGFMLPDGPAGSAPEAGAPAIKGPYAFVDGSFNEATGTYGYGGFLDVDGRRYPIMGSGNDPGMASMRNVAGEIEGSMAAVRKAEELGLRELTILYDYAGIEAWASGAWKTNKAGTAAYGEFMRTENRSVAVTFEKVKGHSGVEGNEMADVMAKKAVGIRLTGPQAELYRKAMSSGSREGIAGLPEGPGDGIVDYGPDPS